MAVSGIPEMSVSGTIPEVRLKVDMIPPNFRSINLGLGSVYGQFKFSLAFSLRLSLRLRLRVRVSLGLGG